MIDAGRLLPKLLDADGAHERMTEVAVKLAFTRAAGDGMRRQAVPSRLNRKTLIVSVPDAMWEKQLQSLAAELVLRINRLLGRKAVEFIEFRVDSATVKRANAPVDEQTGRRPTQPVPPQLIAAAGSIADEGLRERFLRAAENCIERRDSKARAD
jgi:Dna[CI] antecedent, DciA